MSAKRPASLRRLLSIATVAFALLSACTAASLVVSTTVLSRMTADAAASLDSVRAVEEAEVALLLHARARDGIIQRELAGQLRAHLDTARRSVTSTEEARVLREVDLHVGRYLEGASQRPADADIAQLEERAFAALEELVDVNIASTRAAQKRAAAWDDYANLLGLIVIASIVVLSTTVVLWLRRSVMKPLLALADTMRRYGAGNRDARASERGPVELCDMSSRFNEMANALAEQRKSQIAAVGGVAHDLRNPLSALKLAVELVSPDGPLPPEPRLRRTLATIARQIGQLERMLGDFLDVAKAESGTLQLQRAVHDVRDIVGDAIAMFEGDPLARIRVSMPAEPALVVCDAVRMGQAVTNLLSNALKYSPPDEPVSVTIVLGSNVVIEVADRGVGIPRDDHDKIFEPFVRVQMTDRVPGTGLGLYNVQRIVQAHDGRIEVESVPSVGSTFRIYMPRAGVAAAVQAGAEAARS